jgi:phosphoglycolate phosphatase
MKFKMIIWDWNGTLLNDVDYNVTAVNQMLLKQNKPLINREHYRSIFTFPISDFYK